MSKKLEIEYYKMEYASGGIIRDAIYKKIFKKGIVVGSANVTFKDGIGRICENPGMIVKLADGKFDTVPYIYVIKSRWVKV